MLTNTPAGGAAEACIGGTLHRAGSISARGVPDTRLSAGWRGGLAASFRLHHKVTELIKIKLGAPSPGQGPCRPHRPQAGPAAPQLRTRHILALKIDLQQ
ncbi:hypothetical protein E2C01_043022 [Portunus trituberculatus]|uniref:Uncharacterized protein n=1 Tax=Portunus trituberculatus TaxID=210409 RepID=A0A5B7FUZ5_PORTR|nr:hypothetical protein [Portunus trituberculatus]